MILYTLSSLTEEEHLPFLFRKIHSLAPHWQGFCSQLGVTKLDLIKANGRAVDDCFVLGLEKWLSGDAPCTWKVLIKAIFQPAGGNNQNLARDVAASFNSKCCMHAPIIITMVFNES